MDLFVRALWTLLVGAQLFALGRLVQLGIIRRYRFFGSYLVISIARFMSLIWLPVDSPAYCYAWFITEPLMFAATAAVCWEAYYLLCGYFPGNQRFFAKLSLFAGSVAAFASVLLFRLDGRFDIWFRVMFWATRFIALQSAIFLVAVVAVVRPFSWVEAHKRLWPVRSWNNRAHVVCCTILFSLLAATYSAADVLGTRWNFALNCAWIPAMSVLFVSWGIVLRRSGDTVRLPRISEEQEKMYQELEIERIELLKSLRPDEVLDSSRSISSARV